MYECCAGLKTVSNQVRPYGGICAGIVGVSGGDVCVKCGDGTCGAGENYCNCPTDCPLPRCFKEGENYSMEATNRNYCCEGLKNVENLVPLSSGRCSYGYSEYVCTKCGDGICSMGENYCNCLQDCPKCAGVGAMMKSGGPEGADLPERCCDGLTAYTRGGSEWVMEEGCVKKNKSTVPTGYWCIKCGDGICNRDGGEDLCSCPQDCIAEGQPRCNSSSDCILAIYPYRCCTCPQAIHRTLLDGKETVLYQKGMNISAVLPSICEGMFCYPCPTVGEAICHLGLCVPSSFCGNAFCEPGENESSCPSDCARKPVCGNGFCEELESELSCPKDCQKGPVCGNRFCEQAENVFNCPVDCVEKPSCGNGFCENSLGEDAGNCPSDCVMRAVCGNGFCEKASGENATNCAPDCEINSVCGNHACEEDENKSSCPGDCIDNRLAW